MERRELTKRQREVLERMAVASEEIVATGLGVSGETVRRHLRDAMSRLYVNTIEDAIEAAGIEATPGIFRLSNRQLEIIEYHATTPRGDAAVQLGYSRKELHFHLASIKRRLDVPDIYTAIIAAGFDPPKELEPPPPRQGLENGPRRRLPRIERDRISLLVRQPYAILGALGYLGLADSAIQWKSFLKRWIEAWSAFSHRVNEIVFGWLYGLINWDPPPIVYDYVTMGLITSGAFTRAYIAGFSEDITLGRVFLFSLLSVIFCILFWPPVVALFMLMAAGLGSVSQHGRSTGLVFFESVAWAVLIVLANAMLPD